MCEKLLAEPWAKHTRRQGIPTRRQLEWMYSTKSLIYTLACYWNACLFLFIVTFSRLRWESRFWDVSSIRMYACSVSCTALSRFNIFLRESFDRQRGSARDTWIVLSYSSLLDVFFVRDSFIWPSFLLRFAISVWIFCLSSSSFWILRTSSSLFSFKSSIPASYIPCHLSSHAGRLWAVYGYFLFSKKRKRKRKKRKSKQGHTALLYFTPLYSTMLDIYTQKLSGNEKLHYTHSGRGNSPALRL